MRRMLCVVFVALGLLAGTAGAAHAGKSCPKYSRYDAGVCIDNLTGDIVKDFRR